MSLRLQLVLLFTAVLAATLLVASALGLRIGQRSVEEEIRKRTAELASATTLALKHAGNDDDQISEELAATVRTHRGILRAEVARQAALGIDADFTAARIEGGGIVFTRWRGPATRVADEVIDDPDSGRALRLVAPFNDARGTKARLVLLASLAEAEHLVAAERKALLQVAVGASLFLVVAFWILLGRILIRRVSALQLTMRAVEGGLLDVQAPGPREGGDELAYLARGFNRMLAQIRGFNAELTKKIEEATAELTKKNRDLEELNELLVAARRDLTSQERLAALGQLAGTIAHELGNPLNALSGHLQLLARRPDLAEPARSQVAVLQGEVTRMTQIIRRFLDQTRGFTPAAETVELAPLVDEALDLTLGMEARQRIQIAREVDGVAVRTDPGLVRHLLTNLVANAVDAMPNGGRLEVQARSEGRDVVLRVSDTGTGMAPDVKRHIFEAFYTTKPDGKGTGLGLAICKEIARALRGRIDVESEPGKGSAFTVRFPEADAHAA
ncbi:MAG: HAMP domain-containing histidine kinase [Deltaproteobacteria bacterium]|nr:MAG: HAMP domain-containing histidine kinase [Deltaproteobacteria bacterium]